MIYRREYSGSRKTILAFLKKFDDCTLEELLARTDVYLTKQMKHQIHKMQREGIFQTGLELYREERQERIMRSVGMIR